MVSCHGDTNDCIQSWQDHTAAFKEKECDTDSVGDDPGGAARHAGISKVTWGGVLSQQQVDNVCGVLRSYKKRCFISVAWREVR